MPDNCLTDCDLKKTVAEMHPMVKETHEIILGFKTAVHLIKGAGVILGSVGAVVAAIWAVFGVISH